MAAPAQDLPHSSNGALRRRGGRRNAASGRRSPRCPGRTRRWRACLGTGRGRRQPVPRSGFGSATGRDGATRVTAAAARPLHSPPATGGRMAHDPEHEPRNRHSQFDLLRQRRFLPYFTVQALGAFNDNVYRQAIIGLLGAMVLAGAMAPDTRALYTQLAPAIFIVPYFLFSATAGQVAEKLEKQRLIVITTAMEITIMSLAAIGFLLQNMPLLLVALFCTGLQSTLFGPVKYSILPSVL